MTELENFPTEHSKIIQKINAGAITAQSGTAELKEALLITVAAYWDYRRYSSSLSILLNDYDESLETFDPNTWFFRGTEKADELASDCYNILSAASAKFSDLESRAEESCALIVKAVLAAPPAVQNAVLGKAYQIKPDEMDGRIAELFERIDDIEYHSSMQENLADFLKFMEEGLSS